MLSHYPFIIASSEFTNFSGFVCFLGPHLHNDQCLLYQNTEDISEKKKSILLISVPVCPFSPHYVYMTVKIKPHPTFSLKSSFWFKFAPSPHTMYTWLWRLSQILHFLLSLAFGLNLNTHHIYSRLPWAPLLITSFQRNLKMTEFIENVLQVTGHCGDND